MTKIADILFGCELREGELAEFPALLTSRFPFGKFLVLTDEESALALGNALKKIPKKILLVLARGDDLLPLFGLPDGIICVVGAGGAAAAARYFAAARSLPFVGACLSCAPQGLLRGRVTVRVGESETTYPVPPPDFVFAALSAMQTDERGMARAACFLSACALSVFSFRASRRLSLPCAAAQNDLEGYFSAAPELAFSVDSSDRRRAAETIFRAVSAAEYCFRSGFPEGEIFRLIEAAKELVGGIKGEREENELAFSCVLSLLKLYALFFESGFYRGGKVDYNARFGEAAALAEGTRLSVKEIFVPPVEQLTKCAEKFADLQAELCREACALEEKIKAFCADFGLLPSDEGRDKLSRSLFLLPEFSVDTYGIVSLMRDFSLL